MSALPAEIIAQAIVLHESGMCPSHVARALKVSRVTLEGVLTPRVASAGPRFDHAEARRRRAAGEKVADVARALGVSAASVTRTVPGFRRGRRFDFARHCRGEEIERRKALTFLAHDELGAPIDVVAWDTANDTVACWLGLAGLLGLDFPCPGIAGDPLVVFPDPLAWLKADRRGVVIVRPSLGRQHLLEVDAIRAADIAHAGAVESLLLRGLLPRITVPASSVRRAA